MRDEATDARSQDATPIEVFQPPPLICLRGEVAQCVDNATDACLGSARNVGMLITTSVRMLSTHTLVNKGLVLTASS